MWNHIQVEHTLARKDPGRVEGYVQMPGGKAFSRALELAWMNVFGDDQRDMRPMPAVRPRREAGQPRALKLCP
jgi:hypothetical protein